MDKEKRAEELAARILKYSRNELLVTLRFMDVALCKLDYKLDKLHSIAADGRYMYYNPNHILQVYKAGDTELNHTYLHVIMHCIFYHPFVNDKIEYPNLWDLACDIAVECVLYELNLKKLECTKSVQISHEIQDLKWQYDSLTAERLYRKFIDSGIAESEADRLQNIFAFDEHSVWYSHREDKEEEDSTSQSTQDLSRTAANSILLDWRDVSERIKVDLETISKEWGAKSGYLCQNISEVNREKYDYTEFLKKFCVSCEDMMINDEEFDYIYYSYGFQLYKNMPLVEPLEYKEVKKIKEFVIAIDTSWSVSGELVTKFINKTYNILMQQSNFFTKINVHIIQCDGSVQRDDKITSREEFEALLKNYELVGFGGTDFRPVFDYVDELIQCKEFKNLKGLIYFTDGYGFFPAKKPVYDVAFIFVDERYEIPQVPSWATRLVLPKDEI